MALTPTILNPLGGAVVVVNILTPTMNVSLAGAITVLNFPTPYIDVSYAGAVVSTSFLAPDIQVSDVGAVVVTSGRIANPKLRVWTFSLDGHDFYVLRLGDDGTLVYDTYSEQWMDWDTLDLGFWRLNTGMNWIGGQGSRRS